MSGKKAQTAIELITVYGWVVLLILVIVMIAYYSGYLDVRNLFPVYCNIAPTMSCKTFRFGYAPDAKSMVLVYRIVNGLGYDILFPDNSVSLYVENIGKSGKKEYRGNCYPTASPIKPGTVLSCLVFIPDMEIVPSTGKNLDFRLAIRYRNCNALQNYTKTGSCTGAPEYTVSGAIRTQMEPPSATLYACGDDVCDYVLGENPTNCCHDCPVSRLELRADPNPVEQYVFTKLIANAKYADGTSAANATVIFDRVGGLTTYDFLPTNSNITNSTGDAVASYSHVLSDPNLEYEIVVLNISTCGPHANATVIVRVNKSPPNGTIVFTSYPSPPEFVPVGGYYEVNISVYNTSGDPVPFIPVGLFSDADSNVTPTLAYTGSDGIAHANFSSNVTHPGRITAMAIGVWNATNLAFAPFVGRLELSNNGPKNVGSEASIDISGCLYNMNNEPVSDARITITTDFGYFMSDVGTQKMPGITMFPTKRPTILSNARSYGAGYEIFGYNGTCQSGATTYEIADPVEFDAYAGEFVKIMATASELPPTESKDRSLAITSYLNLTGTNGRIVYIFYNTSYNRSWGQASWIYPTNLYNNLTQDLPKIGIIQCGGGRTTDCFQTVRDPQQLKSIMLYNASTTILISANEYLPVEVWACQALNDPNNIPQKFFQRGGIQIHTGDWEYYYALNSSGDDNNRIHGVASKSSGDCGSSGTRSVFNWSTATSRCDGYYVTPVKMNNTATVTTYAGGCFNTTTIHPSLHSTTPGSAIVTASYSSTISNSTVANFVLVEKTCYDGSQNLSCSGTKPLFCINGYLSDRCDICDCTDTATEMCDNVSGSCVPKPGSIILNLTTFNGTGTTLPNDGYTRLQVTARVLNLSGSPMSNVEVEWDSNEVLIKSIQCSKTANQCGDYSSIPSPPDPRAAIYVSSNGSWWGTANVTAKVKIGGAYIFNSTNITVYQNDKVVGNGRWREVGPTLLPADNYTNSSICVSTFNVNDAALGNISICFNSTLGIFGSNTPQECLRTNEYGKVCTKLRSDTPGIANVTLLVENYTGGIPVNLTYYLYTNITFYPIPSSILMSLSPNPTPPCANCSTSMVINATFRDSSGNPIPNIPYVYFYQPNYLIDYYDQMAGPGSDDWVSWGYLRPSYMSWLPCCKNTSTTNGCCSRSTNTGGLANTTFTGVYPPGLYNITAGSWYRCNAEPFSPDNCLSLVTNTSLINVSPIPQTIIIEPARMIKPDKNDRTKVNFTLYDFNGSPLGRVYYEEGITPCVPGKCPSYSPQSYYTNSSGGGSVNDIMHNISGNYTLTFYSYYYNISGWITVSNSTPINFGPNVSSIVLNASPQSAYADGVFGSQITVTLMDAGTPPQPMSNTSVYINPPSLGILGCCGVSCGCSLGTDSNGQVKTWVYSSTIGDANISAYVDYSNGTDILQFSNSTNVTFKPPPANATASANQSKINGDGINTSMITVRFTDSYGTPTPDIPVDCNISSGAVFFPETGLVTNSSGEVSTNLSAIENPATIMCWYSGGACKLVMATMDIDVAPVNQLKNVMVNVSANPNTTTVGSKILVVANITNYTTGASMGTGIRVDFANSYGGILEQNSTITNSSGLAAVNVTAIGPGEIFVKANVSGDFGVTKIEYT